MLLTPHLNNLLRNNSSAGLGRVALANNCNIPLQTSGGSGSWVLNNWSTHVSGPAGYNSIQATFCNWYIFGDYEGGSGYTYILRAGIYINKTFYPFYFNGQRDISVPSFGNGITDPLNLYIPPNTKFFITSRRVAADGGAAGSYNVVGSTGGVGQRQDGLIAGTNPALDFTLGQGVAYGARFLNDRPNVNTSGSISGATPDPNSRGTNYSTGGLSLIVDCGPAGCGQPGALTPGNGSVSGAYATLSGNLLTGISNGGGSGYSQSNPPRLFAGGSGTAATGFGTPTLNYGPSLITGIPRYKTPSVILHGDSITAGYGSVDAYGDLNGNFGFYEQALANRLGVHKFAVSSSSSAGWLFNDVHTIALLDQHIKYGLKPSHVIIALGTNDFGPNTNYNTVVGAGYIQSRVDIISNIWRARGAKIYVATVPPRCTTSATSNKWTTVAEQSPYNVNYAPGGSVDQYNTALRNGTGPKNDGIIDGRSLMQDPVTTYAWRTDCYTGGTAFCADGTHPSTGVGIPFLTANLQFPSFT